VKNYFKIVDVSLYITVIILYSGNHKDSFNLLLSVHRAVVGVTQRAGDGYLLEGCCSMSYRGRV